MLRATFSLAWACSFFVGCSQTPPPQAHRAPASPARAPSSAQTKASGPEKVVAAHLPNAYRLHAKVISGGQPDGEAAFEELEGLGVKTIISVDGAQPDVAMARKYGMRYVHLPHGYDGIGHERAAELAKAVRDLPGAIYVHCHHGKHRSPAAATVACVSIGLLKPQDAAGVLAAAGTSKNYRGLHESAQAARRLDDAQLDALDVKFPETAQLPPLAEAMVAIEHVYDHLDEIAKAGWKPTARHPDLDPAHEALMLWEHFKELARTEAVARKSERFRELLGQGTTAAAQLEVALRDATGDAPRRSTVAAPVFQRITTACIACHREFRDMRRDEKNADK